MEEMMKPRTLPSIHSTSKTIYKWRSKIRIVHVYAPEIIKIEPANFRELVQRLTGKQTVKKKQSVNFVRRLPEITCCKMSNTNEVCSKLKEKKIWASEIPSGFHGNFGNLDRLHEFPLISFDPSHSDPGAHKISGKTPDQTWITGPPGK